MKFSYSHYKSLFECTNLLFYAFSCRINEIVLIYTENIRSIVQKCVNIICVSFYFFGHINEVKYFYPHKKRFFFRLHKKCCNKFITCASFCSFRIDKGNILIHVEKVSHPTTHLKNPLPRRCSRNTKTQ